MRVAATVKIPLSPAGVSRLARAVLAAERARLAALSVTFVGPARMRSLNRRHLGHDYATDVIAFSMRQAIATGAQGRLPIADSRLPAFGDIYICPSVATANARAHGVTPKEELRRLVVHGTLHVLGHEHDEGTGRTSGRMWRKQERYLNRFGTLAP